MEGMEEGGENGKERENGEGGGVLNVLGSRGKGRGRIEAGLLGFGKQHPFLKRHFNYQSMLLMHFVHVHSFYSNGDINLPFKAKMAKK